MASIFPPMANSGVKMYFLSIEVLPSKKGIDLPRYLQKLDTLLCNYSTATSVVYKFKVSGESKILSVVQANNIIGFERTIAGLWRLGGVQVDCYPIISYEHFAHHVLKVHEHLTKTNTGTLSKEGLYWLQFDIDHPDKTTEELINIWRAEAETVLTARYKEGTSIELYKVVAQRKVHVFINAENPEHVDMLSFKLPLMQEHGGHVKITCKAMQTLEDYTSRISSATELM